MRLKLYCFGYRNLANLILEFTDPKIIKLFVNAQGNATHVAQPPGLRGTQFGKPYFSECLPSLVMILTLYKSNNRARN
jgi:hypothetical protein